MKLNKKIAVVEDDKDFSLTLSRLLESVSLTPLCYYSGEDFLTADKSDIGCIISDIRLPGMSGLLMQNELKKALFDIPLIIISAYVDVEMSVQAMQQGAITVLTKPLKNQVLLDAVFSAIKKFRDQVEFDNAKFEYQKKINNLTSKEIEILKLIVNGLPSKCIADQLGICKNTVDVHRANLMKKMSTTSLGDLIKNAICFKTVDINPTQSHGLL